MLPIPGPTADPGAATRLIGSLLFLAVQPRNRVDLVVRGNAGPHALIPVEQMTYGLYPDQGAQIFGLFTRHPGTLATDNEGPELCRAEPEAGSACRGFGADCPPFLTRFQSGFISVSQRHGLD